MKWPEDWSIYVAGISHKSVDPVQCESESIIAASWQLRFDKFLASALKHTLLPVLPSYSGDIALFYRNLLVKTPFGYQKRTCETVVIAEKQKSETVPSLGATSASCFLFSSSKTFLRVFRQGWKPTTWLISIWASQTVTEFFKSYHSRYIIPPVQSWSFLSFFLSFFFSYELIIFNWYTHRHGKIDLKKNYE